MHLHTLAPGATQYVAYIPSSAGLICSIQFVSFVHIPTNVAVPRFAFFSETMFGNARHRG